MSAARCVHGSRDERETRAAAVLAAATSAPNSGACSARWVSSSACHWTPRQKRAAGIEERLDRAVGRVRADLQAVAEPVDGLVMEAVDGEPAAAGQPVQRRVRAHRDGVRGLERLVGLAVLELRAVGQVLVQRPAAGDVERLHPAADREQRQVARGRGGEQGELVLVGDAVDVRAERRVRLAAP